MGLSNEGVNVKWLSVNKGRFALGKKGNQTEYRKLSGLVTGISFRDKEYNNEQWREVVIRVEDDGDAYQFGVSLSSGYGRQLLGKLANADLKSVLTFEPTYEAETKRSGFFVSQGSTALKQKWTRDNPGDLPPLEKVVFKGKEQYDDTKQMKWLEEYYLNNVCSKCAAPSKIAEPPDAGSHDIDDEVDEDVPF